MKLFRKDKHNKKRDEEQRHENHDDGMPPPPTVPNQDPHHGKRQVQQPPRGQTITTTTTDEQGRKVTRSVTREPPSSPPKPVDGGRQSNVQPPPPRLQKQAPPRPLAEPSAPRPLRQSEARVKETPQVPPPQAAPGRRKEAPGPAPTSRQDLQPTTAFPTKEAPPPEQQQQLLGDVDPAVQMQRNAVTRELVKQFVADIWNRGDLDLIPQVCARGLRFNGSDGMNRVGHDGFRKMVVIIRSALEDYHCEIHSIVVEGNKAFCRMRFTGRHIGKLLGYEPSGKHVSWMGAMEFTIQDGLIIKVWELGDLASLEKQLRGNTQHNNPDKHSKSSQFVS